MEINQFWSCWIKALLVCTGKLRRSRLFRLCGGVGVGSVEGERESVWGHGSGEGGTVTLGGLIGTPSV